MKLTIIPISKSISGSADCEVDPLFAYGIQVGDKFTNDDVSELKGAVLIVREKHYWIVKQKLTLRITVELESEIKARRAMDELFEDAM